MIDAKDRSLLELLQRDARLSTLELAEAVGLAASSVHERVKKLEREGYITGYGARVDAGRLGKTLLAFMRLSFGTTESQSLEQVKRALLALCAEEPDVLECHNVAGEDCYVLKLRAEGPARLEELIARIRGCAQSSRSVTSIVLSTYKESALVAPLAPAPAPAEGRA
ncbi:MAG TPA: Lrp/AsnC family transcriptional regulator [Spirochaetales bacterium]|nr:Lrp/AsnC family transcriptional regulator [Spirochaetales bacterium]HRY55752.1 Lrp/AsnC family transcriptional regulator [Spirochaetia bacterium]HRZ64398.1 Lrp/AsnC family transcriptional regulator [Spirochaetia bacterium]